MKAVKMNCVKLNGLNIGVLGLLGFLALPSGSAFAAPAFKSPFKSTVPGITIGNTHLVGKGQGEVLRGSQPLTSIPELIAYGITDVLIFKTETRNEVAQEIASLREAGLSADRITHIPFKWKDVGSFEEVCNQVLDGLDKLQVVRSTRGRKIFFHCTVGEDRTGMLAGLHRLLNEGGDFAKTFQSELCENGYEAGNPKKPGMVVDAIRSEITPNFLKFSYLIQTGAITKTKLDRGVCKRDSEITAAMAGDRRYDVAPFKCKASSKL